MDLSTVTKTFTIERSMDSPADGFTVELAGSQGLNLQIGETINVSVGYRDPDTGTHALVDQLQNGMVEDIEIATHPRHGVITRIKGRDRGALALDSFFERIYSPDPAKFSIHRSIFSPALLTKVAEFPPTPISKANKAKDIAKDICDRIGLTLSWECTDYNINEDFSATGRAIEILRQLISPFEEPQRSKVDIFVQNNLLIIREREINNYPAPVSTFHITDARIKAFSHTKRIGLLYGRLFLEGAARRSPDKEVKATIGSAEIKNDDGSITRKTTETIYVNGIETSASEHTSVNGRFVQSTYSNYYYTERINSSVGVRFLNQPLKIMELSRTEGYPDGDITKSWQTLSKSTKQYSYNNDPLSLHRGHTTVTTVEELDTSETPPRLVVTSMVVETHVESGNGATSITVSRFARDTDGNLSQASSERSDTPGSPIGGIQPPLPIGDGASPFALKVIRKTGVISTDHRAINVHISNQNMDEPQLNHIFNRYKSVSGFAEHEIRMTVLSIPWLTKGSKITITGIKDEFGNEYSVGPALITDQTLTMNGRSMISEITAKYWGPA